MQGLPGHGHGHGHGHGWAAVRLGVWRPDRPNLVFVPNDNLASLQNCANCVEFTCTVSETMRTVAEGIARRLQRRLRSLAADHCARLRAAGCGPMGPLAEAASRQRTACVFLSVLYSECSR